MSDNKRIAKNTILLYIRMLVTMFIALYTSRVILQQLGVDDYGIYKAVGGIVGLISFINSALATGSSRFLTFELGKGDVDRLKRTFSSVFTAHVIIVAIVILISETIGLWFVYNKMSLPEDRFGAAVYAYHISIFTVILSLVQVPFGASIIAHEKMGVYAYISIFDALSKLAICYLIGIGGYDKLMVYASLLWLVQISVFTTYVFYCKKTFVECKIKLSIDKGILKPILSFSSWSLFANGSFALSNQGILILLNMFFSPAVVAARAISLQVISAANQLVNNYRLAVNPQVVKMFAAKDYQGSKNLLLQSTKLSYYLMLIVAVPLFFLIDPILKLWLGDNVPIFTASFVKIGVAQSLFQVFDTSLYTALYAKGRLKENALLSPSLVFLVFPIIYLFFRHGFSPLALSWAYLIVFAVLGLLIKPLLVIKIVNYTWYDIIKVFIPCLYVSVLVAMTSWLIDFFLGASGLLEYVLEMMILIILCCGIVYFVGLERKMREKINAFVFSKISIIKK